MQTVREYEIRAYLHEKIMIQLYIHIYIHTYIGLYTYTYCNCIYIFRVNSVDIEIRRVSLTAFFHEESAIKVSLTENCCRISLNIPDCLINFPKFRRQLTSFLYRSCTEHIALREHSVLSRNILRACENPSVFQGFPLVSAVRSHRRSGGSQPPPRVGRGASNWYAEPFHCENSWINSPF